MQPQSPNTSPRRQTAADPSMDRLRVAKNKDIPMEKEEKKKQTNKQANGHAAGIN